LRATRTQPRFAQTKQCLCHAGGAAATTPNHTAPQLQQIRSELVDPNVATHRCHLVNAAGDTTLIEFGSADAALRCAVEIQRAMAVRNSTATPDERLEFRIGINLGDIIVDGDGVAGDSVNIASRLEAMAEPGGICVSGPVRDQVHGNIGVDFVDLGEQQIRNAQPKA
jgi:adenylate cyclase